MSQTKKAHRAFIKYMNSQKKNNITEKTKKKSTKIDIFKKETVHKMYRFSQLNLFKKNVL